MKVKKWGVILLLFGLLFNTTGYYFSFILSSLSSHAEVLLQKYYKEQDSELVYLRFNLSNSQPESIGIDFLNESEFIYQGNMYDLVARTDSAGISIFKCYSDKRETQAIAELDKKIENRQNQSQDNHKPSPLKELLKYYLPTSNKVVITLSNPYAGFYPNNNASPGLALLHLVITPPPDFYRS